MDANGYYALQDIEAIKQLKARYCRFLDTKQWSAWRDLFTDDFVSDTTETGGKLITGSEPFVAFVRDMLGKRPTVHHVHAPEIELTSATTAQGVWALEDYIRFFPGLNMRGHGHYHETYEKRDGQWRIKTSKLTRLREDIVTPIFSLYIGERLRAKILEAARKQHGN